MQNYWQKDCETASREQLTEWQNERLINTVKRIYNNVPHYRAKMEAAGLTPDDIKSIDDLHKLPFTYKNDLRDTYPYGLFAAPMEEIVTMHASSGTTGKQIVAGYTENDLKIWGDICARQLAAVGCEKTDIVHVSYGYGLFTGGLGLHRGARRLGAIALPVSSGNTERQLTIFQDFGSNILCCTPSYAMYLAESLEAAGITLDKIKLKAGIFGAEPWTEEMRQVIEKKLGLKAYDIYGLTEIMGPGVAYECSEQKGMHVNEDHFIVEIIDPDTGEVLPKGSEGEIVFSAITKEGFPLLRYRTRDIGVINYEPCACGRTFCRMSKPRGRSDDMLIIRGVNVFPSQIETVLIREGYSPNYLIVVDRVNNLDTLEVRVEVTEEIFSDTVTNLTKAEKSLADALKSLLGVAAKVTLCAPGSIERSTGKAKRVIDHRKLH